MCETQTFSPSSKPLGYRFLLELELGIPYNALDLLGSTADDILNKHLVTFSEAHDKFMEIFEEEEREAIPAPLQCQHL